MWLPKKLCKCWILCVSVMTNAHVKLLDDYSKEANGSNFTIKRNQDNHRESYEQMDQLRKVLIKL